MSPETNRSESEDVFEGVGPAGVAQGNLGAVAKYRALVIGQDGVWPLLKYEMITGLFGLLPGALGLFLRSLLYPCLFAECGTGIVFGRNLTIRHPHRIRLGRGVILCDDVTIDGKGQDGDGLIIGDQVFVGKGTAVLTVGGTLKIGAGSNIGTYCRIATRANTELGEKVLIAGFCYLVGGDHGSDRTDIPIIDQPSVAAGGHQIGDGVWLGTKTTVKGGVSIGAHSIIGAHALVTKDIPEFSVAVGTPAKVVQDRRHP